MEMYMSKTGEILSRAEWDIELNKFWGIFEDGKREGIRHLPNRHVNAWERFSKILGLTKVG